ncbi:hypothetical protein ZIOFF_051922 [Zingiber officinale]|uniref:Uncharacterized protein n=1 Tax=Zingiber officinale TaxID=94328 RepID=A0A8J5G339_ZINOF|nr:hypothetical protein ZIOFF_051922 [Zingiber officinale]
MPDSGHRYLLNSDAGAAHRLAELPAPVLQNVQLRVAHQQSGKPRGLRRRKLRREGVAPPVVPVRPRRQGHPPVAIRRRQAQRRLRGLRLCRVVGDGGAGAVAGEEHAAEIAEAAPPRELARSAMGRPLQYAEAVLVRRGERMLRREAVVDGQHSAVGARGQAGGELVVASPGDGADAEAAAVEVDKQGQGLELGEEVEAGGETSGDDQFLTDDFGVGSGGGRDAGDGGEALHVAVPVEPDESADLFRGRAMAVAGDWLVLWVDVVVTQLCTRRSPHRLSDSGTRRRRRRGLTEWQ